MTRRGGRDRGHVARVEPVLALRRFGGLLVRLLVALFALTLAGHAQSPSATRLLLERSDATIEIVNAGRADEGARSILSLSGCYDDADLQSNLFYAPGGGVSARIEQDGGEPALIEAPLVIVVRPPASEGSSDGDGAAGDGAAGDGAAGDTTAAEATAGDATASETVEALDVTATFGRPPCLAEREPADPPRVSLKQGRTTAVGARFFLDRGTDVATMDGPVTLQRDPEGGGDRVEADAQGLEYDLSTGRASLAGDVEVRAGERFSRADRLELDEEAGVAILYGAPAVSREGTDEVTGDRLIYDLETNDVVVEGDVQATFEIEGE